jgi:phosphohistidine phosphatase SixA
LPIQISGSNKGDKYNMKMESIKIINRLLISCTAISLLSVSAGCTTVTHSEPGTTTTIILTRHGDRDALSKELNDKGRARAAALLEAVGNMKITAIYSPDKKRNRDTVKPLAKHLGIETIVVSKNPNVNEVTSTMVIKHSGSIVLWVGNTSNLEGIYSLLGGQGTPPVSYGDLFIMKIKDSGNPEVIKKHYGPR